MELIQVSFRDDLVRLIPDRVLLQTYATVGDDSATAGNDTATGKDRTAITNQIRLQCVCVVYLGFCVRVLG